MPALVVDKALQSPDDVKQEFARRLSKALHDRGWSQTDLGKASGIPRDNISGYTRCRALPSAANLHAIAKALGLEPGDLLPGYERAETERTEAVLQMTQLDDGSVWLRINRKLPMATALEILSVIQKSDQQP